MSSSNITSIKFGIPSKEAFEKFFERHQVQSTTNTPQESTSTQGDDVLKEMSMEAEDDGAENMEVTREVINVDSDSTVAQKKPLIKRILKSFKRRKISSPKVGLSVTERLENIHEDVLVVQDTVKEVCEKISKISLYKGVVDESSEKKIQDNLKISDNAKDIQDAKLLLINSSTSISDLVKYADDMYINPDNPDALTCRCCFQPDKTGGLFKYDFSLGDDFRNTTTNLPREFRNLKSHIVTHLKTKSHIEKKKEFEFSSKEKERLTNRQYRVGMILGRQAYKILKCSESYLKYETDVVVLKEQGCDVGNLNHSRKFVAEFRDSVHATLMTKVRKLVNEPLPATGKPTPISVIADKLTPNRRTLQIVGFHGYVGDKVQSLVAGVPALSGGDGISVTRCLQKGLSNLEIPAQELSSRIVGGAFDGEYFHLGVDSHLHNMMLVSEEAREWYTYQWDIAHIIELAEKDSMQDSSCEPIRKVVSTISETSKSFSHGKSFRLLVEEASLEIDEEDEEDFYQEIEKVKVRVPGHFSETRFATYSAVVIEKWLNNYPLYYRIMNREQKDDLDRIDNAPFVFTCGGLYDAYTVVGSMSNAAQKPNIPCWEIDTIIQTHLKILEEMADILDPSKIKVTSISNSTVLPTLAAMTKEVVEKHEYKNCPLLTKVHYVRSTRSTKSVEASHCEEVEEALKTSAKSVRSLIKNFTDNFKDRMSKERKKNEVLSDVGSLFDVSKIIKLDSVEPVRKHLERYSDLAKLTNNLTDEVTVDDLLKEYEIFVKRVKEIAPNFLHKSKEKKVSNTTKIKIAYPTRYDQIDLYKKILETPVLYKDTGNILHLALTGLTRTHCEAVVEGMGSVLGLNNEKRTTLNTNSVQSETCIRWQGPHPGKGATKLIEESLDRHFSGRDNWHFVSKWDRTLNYAGSKVMRRINDAASKADKIHF